MLWDLMADCICDAAKWQPQGQICHQLGLKIFHQPAYLPDNGISAGTHLIAQNLLHQFSMKPIMLLEWDRRACDAGRCI